jgi:hypothetical protein
LFPRLSVGCAYRAAKNPTNEETMKNTIRTALLCGALAFSTSAFAQVGGAVHGTVGAAASATPPAVTSTTNAQVAAPNTSVRGGASTSVSPNDVNIDAHTASPAADTRVNSATTTKKKHHKAKPASDTSVNTGISTPNASSGVNANVSTTPDGANANTNTNVSTPQPH